MSRCRYVVGRRSHGCNWSDEGLRRAVPHQEGGMSMAATDAQAITIPKLKAHDHVIIMSTSSCPRTRARTYKITSLKRKALGQFPNAMQIPNFSLAPKG